MVFMSRFAVVCAISMVINPFPCEASPRLASSSNIVGKDVEINEEYDYVIVGGGTSGLTVADRLTADEKFTVLVIENGPLELGSARTSYDITSVPQEELNGRRQTVTVGRVVGGCSAINGMIFLRGTAAEYDGWAELGGPDSTWNWEGVFPYFKKAAYFTPPNPEVADAFNITYDMNVWGQEEDTNIYASYGEYQNAAALPIYRALGKMSGVDLPLDTNGGANGLGWYPSSIDPKTFQRSYGKTGHYDGLKRDNYHLVTGHRVNKILFDENTVATAVQFVPSDIDMKAEAKDVQVVKARKEVIIAAGAIHTPQVLQLSGIGPKSLLGEAGIPVIVDLPGVGQKFQDQGYMPNVGYRWGTGRGPEVPQVNLTGSPRNTGGSLGIHVGLPDVAPDEYEDLAVQLEGQDPVAYLPDESDPTLVAGYEAFKNLHAKQFRMRNVSFYGSMVSGSPGGYVLNCHTISHGTVNIDPKNPEAEPIVDYRALSNPVDIDLMIMMVNFMRRFMASPDLEEYEPEELTPGLDVTSYDDMAAWIRQNFIPTVYHPIGTAAKIPREYGGVVDETLRVHGTKNLRVVDASIMPTLIGGPTSLTVYMIAEKAADFIKASQGTCN